MSRIRLSKILAVCMVMTFFSVMYVHQNVEIVKAGYRLQTSRKYLSYLVDQNSRLMYNLSRLESPRNLLASLESEDIEFTSQGMRQAYDYHIARVEAPHREVSEGPIGKILDLFTEQAEALGFE